MTLPAFAQLEDLEDRLPGGIRDADRARAQAAIDFAATLIRGETGIDWVTDDELDYTKGSTSFTAAFKQDVLFGVTVAAALRSFENPESFDQQTGASTPTNVYLTRAERRLVRKIVGGSPLGVVELEIGTPAWTGDTIAVEGQDEPMPFTFEPLRR